MKRIFAMLLFALMVMGTAEAQKPISGTLQNATNQQAVAYANIALLRQNDSTFVRGTTSDEKGYFSIESDTVPTLIRISAIGFETRWVPVSDSTSAKEINLGILQMKEGATSLDAVNITASKPMYAVDGEKKIYNVSEDPTIQNGTAQDALQSTPGVRVDDDGHITLNGKEVTVYINDRESHYSGEMLKQYIKTLTADQISSIEAMEYPPAKYGGGGPVINIRTQQKLLNNSYVSLGAQGSSQPSVSPFISYAYANEKLRFDAYLRYSGNQWEGNSNGNGNYYSDDSTQVRNYNYKSSYSSHNHSLSIDISLGYDFDTMNTLSSYISFSPYWGKNKSDGRHERLDMVGNTLEDFSYSSHNDSPSASFWSYGNIEFEHKFNNEGHQISFDVGGNFYGSLGNQIGTSWEHYDVQTQLDYESKKVSTNDGLDVDLGVNYSFPYSEKGEFSAGFSLSLEGSSNYSLRDTLGADGLYHCDILRSDSTESPQYETRLYLSWRRKFGNFTLRLGGNMNYSVSSNSHLHQQEYDTTVTHFTVGPNVTLLYNTESMHSFSLNYSMNATPPSANQLDRYIVYGIDYYNTGNPQLGFAYSHSLGFGYDKYFEQGHSLGISGNYNWQINEVSDISLPTYSSFFGRYVMFSMPYNAGDRHKGNLYLYGRWRPSALFSLTLSGGFEDDWYRILLRPGEWIEDEMASWNIHLNARTKLFNLVWISVTGYYDSQSHGWSTLEIEEPRWGVDFSASADFFDRKLSFYLNIYDIFNSDKWSSSSINPYAPSSDSFKYNSQYITFGITLRFGNMELGNSGKEGIQESGGGSKGGK